MSVAGQWIYEFEYRDIWGNLRVAFKADGNQLVQTQTQEQDPFGLTIQPLSIVGVNSQNFRFQNQEKVEDFGLNLNWFKYRPEDPTYGRMWQIDRLAEKYVHNSVYAFSENKVTNHIELDGLEAIPVYPSLQGELYRGAGFTHVPNQKESTDLGVKLMKTFTTALVTVPLMFAPIEEAIIFSAGVLAKGLGVVAKEIGMATKFESAMVKETVVVEKQLVEKTSPSLKEQASAIKNKLNNGKNSVNVNTSNKTIHYDLEGATHKGVETPHKQYSYPNTNKLGEVFMNKDRKTVEPINQQDIRIVKKVLENRNN